MARVRLPLTLATTAVLLGAAPSRALAASNLLLSPGEREDYAAAGTWSAAFNPSSIENHFPLVFWIAALVLVGAIGFPYVWLAAASLPDRGYAFARPVGLLLVGWVVWWGASLDLISFSRGAIAVTVLLLAGGAAAIVVGNRTAFLRTLRVRWRLLAVEEGAFWAIFGAVTTVRWLNPDLWHPSLGGEKPMDFAYLNAVVKSVHFPPYDPWFAGGYINYYYFGFVLVAVLVKLTAIVPYVAYNLAIATLAAFLGLAAFGVGASLVGAARRARGWGTYAVGGLTALVFVSVIGNLGEVRVLRDRLDGPIPIDWWYWNPSRVIGHPATEPGLINEFPSFTYLYADLHAHAMALPYTAVVLGLALSHLRGRTRRGTACRVARFGLLALTLGALWPLNTWDVPTYALVVLVVLVIAALRGADGGVARRIVRAGAHWAALVGVAYVAFLPFHRDYVSAPSGVERWYGSRTGLGDYLTIHGFFLFTIGAALVLDLLRARDLGAVGRTVRLALRRPRRLGRVIRSYRALVAPRPLYLIACALAGGGVVAAVALAIAGQGVPALVVAMMTLVAVAAGRRPHARGGALWQATLALVFIALGLTLAVEFFVVAKIDVGRTNTLFKTYLQVWLLFGVGASVAAARLYGERARLRRPLVFALRAGFVTLFAVTLLYPVLATRAKVSDRFDTSVGPTLNGMAFMRKAVFVDRGVAMSLDDDLDAIRWMQEHVHGSPVVAEANTYPTLYGWGSRYAMFTGNADIVGWDFHQRQQRPGEGDVVLDRVHEVQEAYRTRDPRIAYRIFRRYGVQYLVVGPLERAYFPDGREKWRAASGQLWDPAYEGRGVTIYRLRQRLIQ